LNKLLFLVCLGWEKEGASLVPLKPAFKSKITKVARWKHVPIKSSARRENVGKPQDDVDIKHWVKFVDLDYRFARLNRKIKMNTYSDAEYQQYLQDSEWSKAQTDFLFDLCQRFDLRFTVIFDRFTHSAPYLEDELPRNEVGAEPGSDVVPCISKTCEDLKHRFYSIQRILLRLRNSGDANLHENPMFKHNYNPEYELERKNQLIRLYSRQESDVVAMTEMVLENRQLTFAIKALKGGPRSATSASNKSSSISGQKRKQAPAAGATPTAGANSPPVVLGAMAPIPEQCLVSNVNVIKPFGVSLKSAHINHSTGLKSQNAKLAKSVETELEKVLGMGPKKEKPFKFNSTKVCEKYDALRCDLATYFNLKKLVEKKQSESGPKRIKLEDQKKQ
jgi:DNA methyltransferase 1-associated protein 1